MTPYALAQSSFAHYLHRLVHMVDLAQAHAAQHGLADSEILTARLTPDMHAWHAQVEIAANFALRTVFPLAEQKVPAYGEFPASFDGLRKRIGHVQTLLRNLDATATPCDSKDEIEAVAGEANLKLPASRFFSEFGLPNFLFHYTMAYALLRQAGVKVGKSDFDGLHRYGGAPA